MTPETGIHFDSIESAHDFVTLLSQAVCDTRREIEADLERETTGNSPRRLEALRLASYTLKKLQIHTTRSARMLNDLRSLRRLLFEERKAATPKAVKTTTVAVVPRPEAPSVPAVAA